jgi:uncharacterized membrane protein
MRRTRKTLAADVVRAGPSGQDRLLAGLPYLFLVLCLLSTLFQAWNLPPFQGADEMAHAYRVDLVTFGKLSAERVKRRQVVAGGSTDMSLYEASVPFDGIRFNVGKKLDLVDLSAGLKSDWDGRTTRVGYPGSAIYPPFFYLPQASGMALGKLLNRPVVESMHLARAANALACTLLGFVALLIAGRARLLMFALLMLPMSTALFSILGNDGLIIAVTALGVAVISRAMHQGRPMNRTEVIAAAVCFALVGATKPPYAPLGLILLVCDTEKRQWRYLAAGTAVAFAIGWTLWTAIAVQTALTLPGGGIDPELQAQWLLAHPLEVFSIAGHTLKTNFQPYADMFIGVLGWLDTAMPPRFYPAAWTMLGLTAALSLSGGVKRDWRWVPAVSLLAAIAAFGAVHGALYLTWTPVGADHVEGVQGRYFLPLALMLCLMVEGERSLLPQGRVSDWAAKIATAVVMAFPLMTLLAVQHVIISRYYLD